MTVVAPYHIDTAIPRGRTLADWYAGVAPPAGTSPWGELPLVDVRNDVGATSSTGTPRITAGSTGQYNTYYLTFNTPVSSPVPSQCGRAVFSDVHLVDTLTDNTAPWPASCDGVAGVDHTPNMLALEYLFFDLESCVQDDTQPAVIPCSQ